MLSRISATKEKLCYLTKHNGRNIMYTNEGNKDPILLSALCQLYQIPSYLLSSSTVLKLHFIKTFFSKCRSSVLLHWKCLNEITDESFVWFNWIYLLDLVDLWQNKAFETSSTLPNLKVVTLNENTAINKSNLWKFHKLVECTASTSLGANCEIGLIYMVILWAACNAPIFRTITMTSIGSQDSFWIEWNN